MKKTSEEKFRYGGKNRQVIKVTETKTGNDKILSRLFFRLLPVQIILVAIGSINSIIDGMVASKLVGPIAMTIIGLYFPVLKIIDSVNAVLTGGSQILCGRFLGKNEVDNTKKVFTLDVLLTAVFSLILSVLMFFPPSGLARALGANGESIEGLTDYLKGISFGVFAQMLGAQLTAFLQLEQQEKRTYTGIVVMMVSNLSLNLLFIKKMEMGLFGLGLSTSISNWLFCIVQLSFYFTKKAIIRFDLKKLDFKYLWDIIRIGFPGALVQFYLTIRGLAINAILFDCAGNDGLAANSAVNTFGSFYYAATAGVASATRLLVSVYIGEEDRVGLKQIMRIAITKGVALVAGVAAISIAMAVPFTRLFYTDTSSEVYRLAKQFFFIFPFSMPLSCFTVIFINYYQCSERMKMVNVLSLLDGVVTMVVSSYLLAPVIGATGVWLAQVINGAVTVAAVFIYTIIECRHIPKHLDDYLLIPDDFGVPESDRLDISIDSVEGVLNTSEAVVEFCAAHGISRKNSYYAGLAIEEMAGNIVDHGFTKSKPGKKHSIDIRVVYKDGGVLLRFKDNCKPFDPHERETIFNPDDITKNIGIRMVAGISKRMEYQFVLGLNVLSVWM